MKQVLIWLSVGLFVALMAVFAILLSQERDPQSVMIGQKAPALALEVLGSENAPAAPGEAYLVNFWASWCTPCLAEHPALTALDQAGVTIKGVAYRDKPENSQAFLMRHGNPFETVYLDPEGKALIDYGVAGVPESFVVNGQGVITAHVQGVLEEGNLREIILPALGVEPSQIFAPNRPSSAP